MLENLIAAGCFDSLGITRKQAFTVMDDYIDLAVKIRQNENTNQLSLFGETAAMVEEPALPEVGEFSSDECMKKEKEVLGFYVSRNPLEEYREILPLVTTHSLVELNSNGDEIYIRVAGMVSDLKRRVSRKGESYARFYLEDLSGRMEAFLFPSAYRSNIDNIKTDIPIVVEGFFNTQDDEPKVVVNRVKNIPPAIRELHIRVPGANGDNDIKSRLVKLLAQNSGEVKVILYRRGGNPIMLDDKYNVKPSFNLKQELEKICGKGNVWFA